MAREEGRPTVNDMATLLAHAMLRLLAGKVHRPRRLHVRGHPQWKELFPHLDELGVKVAVHRELPKVQRAYQGYLRQRREAHRRGMVKPTAEQQSVEALFPAIAQWVRGYGHIEIGDQEMFGFVARALAYGGLLEGAVLIETVVLNKSRTGAVVESTFTFVADGKLAAKATGGWRKAETGPRTAFRPSVPS